MATATTRIPPPVGRAARVLGWSIVLVVVGAAGAGVVAETYHAPGGPGRAELTWAGDRELAGRLDAAASVLQTIADDVETLADSAKTALAEITSVDTTRLRDSLAQGGLAATAIQSAANDLRTELAGLPGDGPSAAMEYSNATLVRRAAILAAIDAAAALAEEWQQVTGHAANATHLLTLFTQHDQTVIGATEQGRLAQYADASVTLDSALLVIEQVKALRATLIAGGDQTVLDEWIERSANYDLALKALYDALEAAGGEVTIRVQDARREERAAFELLPPDRRAIIVIVAEVASRGLTQAVLAIEETRGRIDEALAEAG